MLVCCQRGGQNVTGRQDNRFILQIKSRGYASRRKRKHTEPKAHFTEVRRRPPFFQYALFVDDGFSGVSFEREGLQSMLREVEAGNVATVITKDLSRLGRNYLKTGELIEIVFPEYEVRYIAINDGVDTARDDNEFTPLRNWFNEFYARDTSKKIRAVKQAKAQKGERVNGEVPYGYIADPNDRNHLLPDPETAHIVKQIFAMYVRGDRICEIQNWLREHEVLTVCRIAVQAHRKPQAPPPPPELYLQLAG